MEERGWGMNRASYFPQGKGTLFILGILGGFRVGSMKDEMIYNDMVLIIKIPHHWL